jgi:hypothetical protein
MARAAVWSALVVLALGALFVVRPFVAAQRDTPAEIPSPAGLAGAEVVPLAKGAPACFEHAVIEPHSEQARFKVYSPEGPAGPLRVTLRGGGYDYTAEVPPGTPDNTQVAVPVPAPPTDIPLRVCIENRGARDIGVFASADRTRSRSTAIVRGHDTERSIWFAFYEPRSRAITERIPVTLERMTAFRPGYVGRGLLWVLLVLFVAGVPAAMIWAYVRAVRDDERAAPRDVDVNERRSFWRRTVDDR